MSEGLYEKYGKSGEAVSYQGVEGSYSHMACEEVFGDKKLLSCSSFEEALSSVEEGHADIAMIPIENGLWGRVAAVHHILLNTHLNIVGEHFLEVKHCLLGIKGSKLDDIQKVISHEQALGQCRVSLRKLGIQTERRPDTAGSALEVLRVGDKGLGAIASELACRIYSLEMLRGSLADSDDNHTRFIAMSKDKDVQTLKEGGEVLTSFIFEVDSIAAALYKCLGGFATNGVNFLKLESYIGIKDRHSARFYAEIEGSMRDHDVREAFRELGYYTKEIKILGSYERSRKRYGWDG